MPNSGVSEQLPHESIPKVERIFVFFETEDGTTGVAPADIREGDLICQFYGCDIVLVLRNSGHNLVTVLGVAILLERTSRSKIPGTDATL